MLCMWNYLVFSSDPMERRPGRRRIVRRGWIGALE